MIGRHLGRMVDYFSQDLRAAKQSGTLMYSQRGPCVHACIKYSGDRTVKRLSQGLTKENAVYYLTVEKKSMCK